MTFLAALALVARLTQVSQAPFPAPVGFVNDFAGVLDSASIRHMDAVIGDVRAKTRGEIAVVTLADIGDRSAGDVALQIGRQWGVGGVGEAGNPARNLGVVVLLVPLRDHRAGTGQVFIATGRGAEGFLTDARAGRIRDAMIPALGREDYGPGLVLGVDLIAQAFAQQFGVTLDSTLNVTAPTGTAPIRLPVGKIILAIVLLLLLTRGRILWLPFWIMTSGRRGWGGWSSGGGWGGGRGWGGGGGGGFGGFGGGGGFSGGGAGGRF